jgi:hypothetical protein
MNRSGKTILRAHRAKRVMWKTRTAPYFAEWRDIHKIQIYLTSVSKMQTFLFEASFEIPAIFFPLRPLREGKGRAGGEGAGIERVKGHFLIIVWIISQFGIDLVQIGRLLYFRRSCVAPWRQSVHMAQYRRPWRRRRKRETWNFQVKLLTWVSLWLCQIATLCRLGRWKRNKKIANRVLPERSAVQISPSAVEIKTWNFHVRLFSKQENKFVFSLY